MMPPLLGWRRRRRRSSVLCTSFVLVLTTERAFHVSQLNRAAEVLATPTIVGRSLTHLHHAQSSKHRHTHNRAAWRTTFEESDHGSSCECGRHQVKQVRTGSQASCVSGCW